MHRSFRFPLRVPVRFSVSFPVSSPTSPTFPATSLIAPWTARWSRNFPWSWTQNSKLKTQALWQMTQATGVLMGLVLLAGQVASAQSPIPRPRPNASTPVTVPDGIRETLKSLDQAASQENLPGVLQYYSLDFTDGDGLNRESLGTVLSNFWTRYENLSYTTSILAATQTPEGWILETKLLLEGTEVSEDRSLHLQSEIRARQTWANNQLLRQETLAEHNTITSGSTPPTLSIRLPETVKVNERFNFDVIIEEPVKEDLVLGAIVDEPITLNGYLNPTIADFQPLVSGGIFKIGKAPAVPDNRWISAIVIRKGGMTLVTQRLRILAN